MATVAVIALGASIASPATLVGEPHATAGGAQPLFEVPLMSPSYGGATIVDLDGDDDAEIVFGTYFTDERVLALHHDGTVHWQVPSGGGPIDGSVASADLDGDGRPEVMWGNALTTEFHVADAAGEDIWSKRVGGVLDAPAAIADVNGDGRLDIVLASCGGGGLRAYTGATGDRLWQAELDGCYQSAPLLFDQDGDDLVDVVVSTWFDNKVLAFSGIDGHLRWETTIGEQSYHAGSFGDLNSDGTTDVALGDYSGTVWALDGASGDTLWSRKLPGVSYIFGPTAMADLDGDGRLEVVVTGSNGARLYVLDSDGQQRGMAVLPGDAARGPVLTDHDRDGLADVLVALGGPLIRIYRGRDLSLLLEHAFADEARMSHHPTIADVDGDGLLEVFTVYGRGQSDTPDLNWGKAVLLSLGCSGPEWPVYSHDLHHSGNYGYPVGEKVNPTPPSRTPQAPTATPTDARTSTPLPTMTPTPRPTATPLQSRPLLLPSLVRDP